MSQKQAKRDRKQSVIPTPVYSVTISFMSDNTVSVNGFPRSLDVATDILDQGKRVLVNYFVNAAKDGKLDDKNVVDGGNILVPDKKLVSLS